MMDKYIPQLLNNKIMKKLYIFLIIALFTFTMPTNISAVKWNKYKIGLDPGHGGSDPGAPGPSAPHEAELALRCGLEIRRQLQALGAPVVMTRTTNQTLSLSYRRNFSVNQDPYIFTSIHLNAFNGTAHGTETWYYHSSGNSYSLAQKVQNGLMSEFKTVSGFTPTSRGVKQNGWTVITGSPNVPAVLTEGLFVDNRTEWSIINKESNAGFKAWVKGHLMGFWNHLCRFNGSLDRPGGSVAPPKPTPTLSLSESSLDFGSIAYGNTITQTFIVRSSNLSGNISVSVNNGSFTIDKTSLPANGGSVAVTFKPTAIQSYTATITVKGGNITKTLALKGVGVAKPLKFKEYWNLSEQNNKKESKGYDASLIRNMAYANGKLYTVYNHNKIKVINAQKGEDLGDLNEAGVGGGVLKYCDVQTVGNQVVACNLSDGTSPFKVYVWDNDTQNPRVFLETTDLGGAKRLGDCFNVWGNLNSGALYLGYDDGKATRILEYKISNGVCSKKPRVFYATTDGTNHLNIGNSCRVIPQSSGYWINGKDTQLTRLDNSGKRLYYVETHDDGARWSNCFTEFTYEGNNYGLLLTFDPGIPDETAPWGLAPTSTYKKASMQLIKKIDADNWSKPVLMEKYPAAGLGNTSQNKNGTGNVISNVCNGGKGVEVWVLSTTHGLAYLYAGTCPWDQNVNPIPPLDTTPVLSASVSALDFKTVVAQPNYKQINISGKYLKSDINLSLSGTNSNMFSISKSKIAKVDGTGTISITYNPTAEGSHNATLSIASSGAATLSVKLNGTAIKDKPVIDENSFKLTRQWIHSAVSGNNPNIDWMNFSVDKTRQLAFKNGNLYIVNNDDNGQKNIIVADAYTGKRKGTLSNEGAAPGWFGYASVANMNGTVVASGLASGNTAALKVYSWANDNAKPVEILNTTNHGGRAGDLMSVSGNIQKGKLWVYSKDDNKFYVYTVTNGKADATPKVIEPKNAKGEPLTINSSASVAGVYENGTGTFWANGNGIVPTEFNADGSFANHQMPTTNLGKCGTNFAPIFYRGLTLVALADYKSGLNEGFLKLYNVTDGYDNAQHIGSYDILGNAAVPNSTNLSHIETYATDIDLHIWILIPKQGAAYYKIHDVYTDVEDILKDKGENTVLITSCDNTVKVKGTEASSIQIFTLTGANVININNTNEVSTERLSNGIYIVIVIDKEGNKHVQKIII